jgi:hypothetical protein
MLEEMFPSRRASPTANETVAGSRDAAPVVLFDGVPEGGLPLIRQFAPAPGAARASALPIPG